MADVFPAGSTADQLASQPPTAPPPPESMTAPTSVHTLFISGCVGQITGSGPGASRLPARDEGRSVRLPDPPDEHPVLVENDLVAAAWRSRAEEVRYAYLLARDASSRGRRHAH